MDHDDEITRLNFTVTALQKRLERLELRFATHQAESIRLDHYRLDERLTRLEQPRADDVAQAPVP